MRFIVHLISDWTLATNLGRHEHLAASRSVRNAHSTAGAPNLSALQWKFDPV